MIAYKNRNTGQVVPFPAENPRLEALNEWERVDSAQVPATAAAANDLARAQRATIEAAAKIRYDTAAGRAQAVLAEAGRTETAAAGPAAQPLPTLSHADAAPTQATSLVALLDKEDPARRAPSTSYEETRRIAEAEAADPPRDGVLARAKRDQRTGATQVASNAEEKPGPPATHENTKVTDGGGGTEPAAGAATAPAAHAPKADWVAYAVSRGATDVDANGLTKQQLVDKYGGK